MALLKSYFKYIILALSLSACGGGGGGDDERGGGDIIPPDDSQNVNSGLSGHLYVNEQDEGWAIDLATGNVSQLPKIQWIDTGEYDTGIPSPSFDPYPNREGSLILLLVKNCFKEFEGVANDYDCMSVLNSDGDMISQRGVLRHGLRDGKLSDDGGYIAVTYADEYYLDPLTHLLIYDRSFNIISDTALRVDGENHKTYSRGFDWARNGQLVYAYEKSIYITSQYSTEGVVIYSLPDSSADIFPVPGGATFSPDGTKIAFRYVSGANIYMSDATIWVMNIDGTDPHQLAHDPVGGQFFNNYAWSPDGKYILTQVGGTGNDPITGGTSNRLYAIPSSSRNVSLECNGLNGVICVRTYFKSPQNLTSELDPYSSVFEWIE
jgi:hypothetical protein